MKYIDINIGRRLPPFDIHVPSTLKEAISLIDKYGYKARILAGGTDLIPLMKVQSIKPAQIITLRKIKELSSLKRIGNVLHIGPLTTVSCILESVIIKNTYPSLYQAATQFGTPQVRNMATIGGNICRSSPGSDLVPPLMSFEAQVELTGKKGKRTIPLSDFFLGKGKNTINKEILTKILVPAKKAPIASAFIKITRNTSDLAKINCAVFCEVKEKIIKDISIVLGAVDDRPVRANHVEMALINKTLSVEAIHSAVNNVKEDIHPITDARSTEEYRRNVAPVVVKRAIFKALNLAEM